MSVVLLLVVTAFVSGVSVGLALAVLWLDGDPLTGRESHPPCSRPVSRLPERTHLPW